MPGEINKVEGRIRPTGLVFATCALNHGKLLILIGCSGNYIYIVLPFYERGFLDSYFFFFSFKTSSGTFPKAK